MTRPRCRSPLPCPPSPISLPHLINADTSSINGLTDDAQEDIFSSALSLLNPAATSNQHGDPGAVMVYNGGNRVGQVVLQLSQPEKEQERLLFAHYVWNAGVLLAECLGQGWWWSKLSSTSKLKQADWNVKGLNVVELGAGTGLAGMCSALTDAHRVDITDYPAKRILSTLITNVQANIPSNLECNVEVQGHEWGDFGSTWAMENAASFDIVLAADTLWIGSAHAVQAKSMRYFLRKKLSARVWMVGGFHTGRPKVRDFFEEELPKVDLEVLDCWEVDVSGKERPWDGKIQEGFGDSSRWCVVAQIGWKKYVLGSAEQS